MPGLVATAAQLATARENPAYDCFYLTLSIQRQYPVVTADMRFHDRAHALPYLANRIVHIVRAAGRAH